MISIDGSPGEGGGRIPRASLALSLVTGRPFRTERVRTRRQKPGLLNCRDYVRGKIRVLANPPRYPTESRTDFNPGLIAEV